LRCGTYQFHQLQNERYGKILMFLLAMALLAAPWRFSWRKWLPRVALVACKPRCLSCPMCALYQYRISPAAAGFAMPDEAFASLPYTYRMWNGDVLTRRDESKPAPTRGSCQRQHRSQTGRRQLHRLKRSTRRPGQPPGQGTIKVVWRGQCRHARACTTLNHHRSGPRA
jgi:hypothetical protein